MPFVVMSLSFFADRTGARARLPAEDGKVLVIDFGYADGEYSGSYITFLGTMVGAVVKQTVSLLRVSLTLGLANATRTQTTVCFCKTYLAGPLRFENSSVFGSF
jgi:hypothetical protein